MSDDNKTVFISYRRSVSAFIVRALFQDLQANGYDVFMDIETLDSGHFEQVILNQIAARAHFLIVLMPGTLDRCREPNDLVRREIELAIDLERNIVPVLTNDFDFKANQQYLTGKLASLPSFNGLVVPPEYFEEAMERLRTRFLRQPVYGKITPTPSADEAIVTRKIEQTSHEPAPTSKQLSAEQLYGSASVKYYSEDIDGALKDYSAAIDLNPSYSSAYFNRGLVYGELGDVQRAIADFGEVIRIDPAFLPAYVNRAGLEYHSGDLEAAIRDYADIIRLDPEESAGYNNRGECYFAVGNYQEAHTSFVEALDRNANDPYAVAGIAISLHALGQSEQAITYWKEFQAIRPQLTTADQVGEELRWRPELVQEAQRLLARL